MTVATQKVDGRNARRDRNTEAVLAAVLELFADGQLVPTAEDVAKRSGISLRSVYRYFEDTEALLQAAIAHHVAQVEPTFVLPRIGEGTLPERIDAFVSHRVRLFTRLAPTIRAAQLRAPSTPQIAGQLLFRRRQLWQQAEEHFAPELSRLGETTLICVDTLCEFESVEVLRTARRLTVARTKAVLVEGVTLLLDR